jgi:hypothetical protein
MAIVMPHWSKQPITMSNALCRRRHRLFSSRARIWCSTYLSDIERLYADYLGRVYSPEQARQHAASLMLHIFGIRVYGYLGAERDMTMSAVKAGLPWLPCDTLDNG